MKKIIKTLLLMLILTISLTSCSFHNFSYLKKSKMNILDLPKIENVEFVKKFKNLVSETLYLKGDEETFTSYANEVYQYLNEKFYDTLGYGGNILNSAWGFGGISEYYNKTSSISDFKTEDSKKIMYQFIFSSDNKLETVTEDNDLYCGSVVLSKSCNVTMVYYKDTQYINDKVEYNMGVEIVKYIGHYNHILVNSDKFSMFIYDYSHNLKNKEYHVNLFLEEYDLSKMSVNDISQYIYLYEEDTTEEGTIYISEFFGYSDEGRPGKYLMVIYKNSEYVRHEIVDIYYNE